jgi:hypothetical protein
VLSSNLKVLLTPVEFKAKLATVAATNAMYTFRDALNASNNDGGGDDGGSAGTTPPPLSSANALKYARACPEVDAAAIARMLHYLHPPAITTLSTPPTTHFAFAPQRRRSSAPALYRKVTVV